MDCWYSLEPPRRPQSLFLSRNKKNNVYPCKSQFYYIKVGFKGVKIIQACFRDVSEHLQDLPKDQSTSEPHIRTITSKKLKGVLLVLNLHPRFKCCKSTKRLFGSHRCSLTQSVEHHRKTCKSN